MQTIQTYIKFQVLETQGFCTCKIRATVVQSFQIPVLSTLSFPSELVIPVGLLPAGSQ